MRSWPSPASTSCSRLFSPLTRFWPLRLDRFAEDFRVGQRSWEGDNASMYWRVKKFDLSAGSIRRDSDVGRRCHGRWRAVIRVRLCLMKSKRNVLPILRFETLSPFPARRSGRSACPSFSASIPARARSSPTSCSSAFAPARGWRAGAVIHEGFGDAQFIGWRNPSLAFFSMNWLRREALSDFGVGLGDVGRVGRALYHSGCDM